MKKRLLFTAITLLAVSVCGQAQGSTFQVLNSESFNFIHSLPSTGVLGDPENEIWLYTLQGGFTANYAVVAGSLFYYWEGGIYGPENASHAHLLITAPNGTADLQPSSIGYYGDIYGEEPQNIYICDVGPSLLRLSTPFDPAGELILAPYQSHDGRPHEDQFWSGSTTIEFQERVYQHGNYNLGMLPANGNVVSTTGYNCGGGLDFYDLELPAAFDPATGYFNVQTYDINTGDSIDTEIALFDEAGILVAYDDYGQDYYHGDQYSMLSFGVADPYPTSPISLNTQPGEHGSSLPGGSYTLVVSGYNCNFGDLVIGSSHISEVLGGCDDQGRDEGDYGISFSFAVPEPSMVLPLCFTGLLAFRRRK